MQDTHAALLLKGMRREGTRKDENVRLLRQGVLRLDEGKVLQ
jgi:hypothetical protein